MVPLLQGRPWNACRIPGTVFADKDRLIITTCTLGLVASIVKQLKDCGFTNVKILEGGNMAWKEAGLPLEEA